MSPLPQTGPAQPGETASSSASPVDSLRPPRYKLACNSVNRFLDDICLRAKSKQELVLGIAGLMLRSGAIAFWAVARKSESAWHPPTPIVDETSQILELIQEDLDQALAGWADSPAEFSLICQDIRGSEHNIVLIAPLVSGNQATEVLVSVAPKKNSSGIPLDWTFATACARANHWQQQQNTLTIQANLATVSGVLGVTNSLNRTTNRLETAITLVNEIKGLTRSQQVSLLLRSGSADSAQLAAISDVEHFDNQSESTQIIEALATGIDDQPVYWKRSSPARPPESGDASLNGGNLSNYCDKYGTNCVAVIPLKTQNGTTHAWLVLGFSDVATLTERLQHQLEQIGQLLSGQLEVVLRTQRSLGRIAIDNSRQFVRRRWVRLVAAAVLGWSLMMCVPFSYKVPCDCQLQLTQRRFVAAPYEGLLETTLVDNGDIVTAGQVLARMDGAQLRMELEALTARMQSERKRRDSALARGNIAESQIASSEMNRLESEIGILGTRIENTEIRSPLDGVVVSGDLDKAQGVPMRMGQTLFEIGPLEKMLVEIHIPENEIRLVQPGMPVVFEFDAFPFLSFTGKLQRIHPRAEINGSDSVFVGELEIENPAGQLRPGMEGRARIRGHRYPLGWNLFHHAWEDARHWLFW